MYVCAFSNTETSPPKSKSQMYAFNEIYFLHEAKINITITICQSFTLGRKNTRLEGLSCESPLKEKERVS